MSFYVNRSFVCDRLRVSRWSSYQLVRPSFRSLVSSESVIALLNAARRARQPEIDFVPSDIVTPEEAERKTGIPSALLKRWSRRMRKAPPHYLINKHTLRFRISSLTAWLERNDNV